VSVLYFTYIFAKMRAVLLSFLYFAIGFVKCDIFENMEKDEVIPDVIDVAPKEALQVTYPEGKKVNFGEELTPTQVKDPPTVNWTAAQDAYYTLAMVDPDAPSRENPTFRAVNHWLIGNIFGLDLESGDVITAYAGSGPPKGSGLHRYVFLVFKQNEKLNFDEPR
ncbi:hypothetical protein AMK59_2607, partial [Oryctes borbonicus]